MKKDDKEKLMNEVLGKSRSFSNVYTDSMDIIKSTEKELNRLLAANEKSLADFNYSDAELNSLKKEIEKDFNISIDTPDNIPLGKANKEVFEQIENDLKKMVVGQDKACEALSIAFRRPYVVGSDPQKIRNTIILYGSNGTGRHELVEAMAQCLKKYNLTVTQSVSLLDMSRYQTSSQEVLFLQDLYAVLNNKDAIVIVENYEEASSVYVRMLAELSMEGRCILNKRYALSNGQLQEASSKLSKDIIDHLNGNNKTLVFIGEDSPSKLMDVFGKAFVDKAADKIATEKLSNEAIFIIIQQLLAKLVEKCQTQLEVAFKVDNSVNAYLKTLYEPGDGMDSLTPIIDKIYQEVVDIVLKHDDKTFVLQYSDKLELTGDKETFVISIIDDSSKERAEIQAELDSIVGLDKVKNYLLSLENHLRVTQIRKQKGLKISEVSKHMIFTGNPGTGKTTIARIVSRMMKVCGILKQGQLVEVTRANLVGKYVGHTAPLTMDVINSALGGVLFIDEAYSLYRGHDDSFGLEAIDTIVKAMEDHRDDLIVILAGYSKEMEDFLTANSGLKSRFANIIHFDDYTGEELMLISKSVAKGKDYRIDEKALQPLKEYFDQIQAKHDPNAGNGRLARNLVEAAILKQSKRLLEDETAEIDLLLLEDFDLQ